MSDEGGAMTGLAALPRQNGELVFGKPWEGRAFGIAVALTESGAYDWESFRQRLIAEIDSDQDGSEADDAGAGCRDITEDASRYYQHWLASLEQVVLAAGLLTEQELAAREAAIAAADDHDHDHDHNHDHGHDHARPTTREVTA